MEICRSLLQVFFLLFKGKDTCFQEKQKPLCTRMDLDGSYVKMQWVDARQNDYLTLYLCSIRELSVLEEQKRIVDTVTGR